MCVCVCVCACVSVVYPAWLDACLLCYQNIWAYQENKRLFSFRIKKKLLIKRCKGHAGSFTISHFVSVFKMRKHGPGFLNILGQGLNHVKNKYSSSKRIEQKVLSFSKEKVYIKKMKFIQFWNKLVASKKWQNFPFILNNAIWLIFCYAIIFLSWVEAKHFLLHLSDHLYDTATLKWSMLWCELNTCLSDLTLSVL